MWVSIDQILRLILVTAIMDHAFCNPLTDGCGFGNGIPREKTLRKLLGKAKSASSRTISRYPLIAADGSLRLEQIGATNDCPTNYTEKAHAQDYRLRISTAWEIKTFAFSRSSMLPMFYPPQFDVAACCPSLDSEGESSTCLMGDSKYAYIEPRLEEKIILRSTTKNCGSGYLKFEPVRIKLPVSCGCAYPYLKTDVTTPKQDS